MIVKEKFILLEQEVENYSERARLISRYESLVTSFSKEVFIVILILPYSS